MIGGLHSIVMGDVIKYIIMTAACLSIGYIAMTYLHDGVNALNVPLDWQILSFFWKRPEPDWSNIIPQVNQKIKDDNFGLFSIFFMMMLFSGVFASLAGPAPNYDMQNTIYQISKRSQ